LKGGARRLIPRRLTTLTHKLIKRGHEESSLPIPTQAFLRMTRHGVRPGFKKIHEKAV
jgi:hypothetical protein